MSYLQAVVLGLLQGISELFPISSLGHSVLLPHLLGWTIDLSNDQFVTFVVLTHLATALTLLGFFLPDWIKIIGGMLRSLYIREIRPEDTYARIGWLLVVSTIPAGALGLLFQTKLEELFGAATIVAAALLINGLVLYAAELLKKYTGKDGQNNTAIARVSWTQAVYIGFAQSFALIPGFSRTGFTMTGGLLSGLSHENAARYAFLLATPIIFAAAVLELPSLFTSYQGMLPQSIVGALCAAIAAYLSVKFLTKYFETKTLTPFAIYCVLVGALSLFILH